MEIDIKNPDTTYIKDMLAMTLQQAIAELGFLPDETGAFVKETLAGDDLTRQIALGAMLESCIQTKSFEPLTKGIK